MGIIPVYDINVQWWYWLPLKMISLRFIRMLFEIFIFKK